MPPAYKSTHVHNQNGQNRSSTDLLLLPDHFSKNHHHVSQLWFRIIDGVPRPRRGGDRERTLKQLELRWIYELNTLEPNGLNNLRWIYPYKRNALILFTCTLAFLHLWTFKPIPARSHCMCQNRRSSSALWSWNH
ncbi:hypothetical protein GDO81_015677 [Engystomops pustulosus]|uniref:Uncharacterized protein n=1 Tax=Engystomops pustulosus TaxID=76066 RepID=A0AAV7AMI6_ENGPU|nr:hypothetical protein GDO81_015677 [Engystomops pustulosus]